jgi:hypothetical protein
MAYAQLSKLAITFSVLSRTFTIILRKFITLWVVFTPMHFVGGVVSGKNLCVAGFACNVLYIPPRMILVIVFGSEHLSHEKNFLVNLILKIAGATLRDVTVYAEMIVKVFH